uniref:non-specific serine/threonine protein kinase n=1 Tax=Cyprinus carpio TaxID=7962 RepID=A0A8C1LDT7_CYPCA
MRLHFILQHLDKIGTYVRNLFVDFSLAFNTIIPTALQTKLTQPSVPSSICQWIISFLTDRQQLVRLGKFMSNSHSTNTGAPQGCVLSPRLFSLYIYFLSIASNRDVNVPVHNITDFVIKVEYHENGPLFSELNYKSQKDTMNNWKKFKRLEFLGIPIYWGSGLTESNGIRLMDRLGIDLQIVFMENGGELKKPTVLQLGLDVLEYIHDNEYIHADIKAANLLLQGDSVYLADYGLSDRYCPNGDHKEYKENPKKGHNGTIEYTSIDVHKEVAPSRRGDLEVLGYCLLHWQCGTLPWLSSFKNPADVQEAKAKLMSNLPDSVLNMSTSGTSTEIARYLSSVKNLGYNEKPEYQTLRKILSVAGPQGPLDLSRPRLLETGRPTTQRVSVRCFGTSAQ